MADLLYEIGTEEIPAGYIRPALDALKESFRQCLGEASVVFGEVFTAGTPRRLVLAARDVAERQADRDEEVVGPPARIAFASDGSPTRAAEGFAEAQGVAVDRIEVKDTPKGKYCVVRKHTVGRPTIELLAEILPRVTLGLAFPKSMMWPGAERPFARPVRYIAALFGEKVVPFRLFGLDAGRTVEGHPMLAPGRINLEDADYEKYKALLRRSCVIVEPDERRRMIVADPQFRGVRLGRDPEDAILEEVVNLVQYPSVSRGRFDPAFLELPPEVVVTAMTEHQRYFPVWADDRLQPEFVVVSDRGPNPSPAVARGNERVLLARLADARFFYETDRKIRLEDRVDRLAGVQFLTGMGSYLDKSRRLEELCSFLAITLGFGTETAKHARRAARLCKADLLTEMVGEFPALQGVMGRVYALGDGEASEVAMAIEEHYLPRAARDRLPTSPAGLTLSLAEKLDNVTACAALDLMPTGSADPYAVRRQSQAILRIVADRRSCTSLSSLFRAAQALLPEPYRSKGDVLPRLTEFMKGRLFALALDEGAPHDLVRAALAAGWDDVPDFLERLGVLRRLSVDPVWPRLVEAVERTCNISRGAPSDAAPDPRLYSETLEKRLGDLYARHGAEIRSLVEARDYEGASRRYVEVFADPLHEFFATVYVNVPDAAVRANRLALLRAINRLYSERVADLSEIVTGIQQR